MIMEQFNCFGTPEIALEDSATYTKAMKQQPLNARD